MVIHGAMASLSRATDSQATSEATATKRLQPVVTSKVIQALANALKGPTASTSDFPSSSDPRKMYTVTVMGPDMDCTCPGFEYRGTCKHIVEVRSKGGRK